ncbi:MAG: DUF5985 family protein [Chthoniobacterales bacterium]|jgi:hypothetical protein
MGICVYLLSAAASLLCAVLLIRGYRASRAPLLFWGALCFFALAAANSLLFIDLVVLPELDLAPWRSGLTLVAFGLLLYGLIFESQP